MSLEETFTNLSSFLNSLDAEGEQKFELSHSLVIICPDCGKNIAFRGRCPKCGGNSWIPAGHAGGIFERMKAQRFQRLMRDDDDTASFRPGAAAADAGGTDVGGGRDVSAGDADALTANRDVRSMSDVNAADDVDDNVVDDNQNRV